MKRSILLFCSMLMLCIFFCGSKQRHVDHAIDLTEAYKIASIEAKQWSSQAEPYFISSVDDPIKSEGIKGENGRRNYWNFDFVVRDTNKHLIISVQDKTIVSKTEAESNVNNDHIIDIREIRISSADAVDIAKENYGLLPGIGWAEGYHFVLENSGSAPVLSVVGRNEKGLMSRVFFNAKTGEVISYSKR